jgi:TIR domain-containing protein
MSLFISYSHDDAPFADRLALALIKARVHVWVDRWELKVGDSLLQRIEAAIDSAGALLVVLSPRSVASEWCRKELTAGLVRELEERHVLVLPALLETCTIPLFLRDKLYADFRSDFDQGLKQVLNAVAGIVSVERARSETDDATTDWALDWGALRGEPVLQLTFVQEQRGAQHSVLTVVQAFPNSIAASRNAQYAAAGLEWLGNHIAAEFIASAADERDIRLLLTDRKPATKAFAVRDPKTGLGYDCEVTSRMLGADPGHDILVTVGGLLGTAVKHIAAAARPLNEAEKRAVTIIHRTAPGG